ncbi:hypothetical protein WOLCODRAFT_167749 [Wolfiporia cocos MD-104 SS10]|uniref:Uncharacterized protein n=1 Tax=Wolfiporia cocos (strain MD-104) TaxID=742152 RepID=A0A2H3JJP7_WOLCO|nr:hypothetical protein WOLCODRAFT_167749 [Wolfiporia cocos MD-104 SS10]
MPFDALSSRSHQLREAAKRQVPDVAVRLASLNALCTVIQKNVVVVYSHYKIQHMRATPIPDGGVKGHGGSIGSTAHDLFETAVAGCESSYRSGYETSWNGVAAIAALQRDFEIYDIWLAVRRIRCIGWMPSIFPDPEEFRPEQWIKEEGALEQYQLFFAFSTGSCVTGDEGAAQKSLLELPDTRRRRDDGVEGAGQPDHCLSSDRPKVSYIAREGCMTCNDRCIELGEGQQQTLSLSLEKM